MSRRCAPTARACGSSRPGRSSRAWRATAASAPSRRCGAPSTAGSASDRPTTAAGSRPKETTMQIAIPLYDRFTALDAVGPYEVLSRLPGVKVTFVAAEPGVVRTDTRMLSLSVEATFDDVPAPDVVVVPGGIGSRTAMHDERMLEWVRAAHEQSTWT